jgi:hypothetical protein
VTYPVGTHRRWLSAALTGCGVTLLLVVLSGALLPSALELAGLATTTVDAATLIASAVSVFVGGSMGAARRVRDRSTPAAEVFLAGLGGVILAWLVSSLVGWVVSLAAGGLDERHLFDRVVALLLWTCLGALGAGLRTWVHMRSFAR